jgi:hypothetical protein
MSGNDLIVFEANPDAGHVGRAVGVERDEMRERAGGD